MFFFIYVFENKNKNITFLARLQNGDVAEWLGRGLQNLLQRFESARRLQSFYASL